MIDEIDYFPRRDGKNKKKAPDNEWGELKKQKTARQVEKNARDKAPADSKASGDK